MESGDGERDGVGARAEAGWEGVCKAGAARQPARRGKVAASARFALHT
jgi:hypothetical protein